MSIATTEQPTTDVAIAAPIQGKTTTSRDEYIAAALADAYSRASTLILSRDESDALTAEFEDDAVERGAGGKDDLLYIGHAYVEERMNRVLGVGQWTFIPRATRREHTKNDKYGNPIYTVFVDGVLLVRGCYVGEDWASMDYIPANGSMSYDDAYSGAQSNAIRRISAKRLGIGLQCWKKGWCAGWKDRQREDGPAPKKATNGSKPEAAPDKAADTRTPAEKLAALKAKIPGIRSAADGLPFRDAAKKTFMGNDLEEALQEIDWRLIEVNENPFNAVASRIAMTYNRTGALCFAELRRRIGHADWLSADAKADLDAMLKTQEAKGAEAEKQAHANV